MTSSMIKVGKPDTSFYKQKLFSIFSFCIGNIVIDRITFWHLKPFVSSIHGDSKPNFVVFYQRKNFFVGNRIHIPYNQKTFAICYQLLNKFTKETKWWISYYNICLV